MGALPSVKLSSDNSIAILTFADDPGYPRLSGAVLAGLRNHLRAVHSAGCFEGVVIAANSRSFATGAMLEEVSALGGVAAFEFARMGQALCREIEGSLLPVVAAIRGFCLGGGLDLALACHRRVAAYDSSFGCPGAALGLVTGWGGTVRLPRLVGRAAALQMLVTAERLPAAQALVLGLVDELAPLADLIAVAADWARRSASSG
ncbi:MAG TPA: enoyl-CoA hydratase/isomerase family protein [Terriglobia bacterium]|nr:enoyl-CoA hydratase/isomerase family protein [Terriglobia bacterium]